jgi:hypothetical protein
MISREQLQVIDEQLQAIGYAMRSGSGSTIYYVTSREMGLRGGETYCLILEESGWRLNDLSTQPQSGQREKIEDLIRATLEGNRENLGA